MGDQRRPASKRFPRVRTPAPPPIPLTRIVPPSPHPGVIARPRLHALLTAAVATCPLTLVAATAGSGKTLLLTSWLGDGRKRSPIAWVGVDRDDDGPRFWAVVLEALRRTEALPAGSPVFDLAPTPTGVDDDFLARLVNALWALEVDVVLVFDDFQELSDPAALESFRYLLRHLPPRLRLVVAARRDPALPLARLRVTGGLAEIRADALAFSVDEAEELLSGLGVVLEPADVRALVRRTEGWAAGVALAGLALKDAADPADRVAALAQTERAISDFLAAEVLGDLPPATYDFLVRTSVVDKLTGGLADALTGQTDGAAMLAELARTNAFVMALGGSEPSYRYHRLLVEHLRGRVAELPRETRRSVDLAAANWLSAHGRDLEAVRHAVAAEQWSLTAELLGAHWLDAFLAGRVSALRGPVEQLPQELTERSPELALARAGYHLERGEVEDGDWFLGLAERAASPADRRGRLADSFAFVTLYRARMRGDLAAAVRASRAVGTGPAPGASDGRRALVLQLLGSAEKWTDNFGDAARHLRKSLGLARRRGGDYLVLGGLGELALLEAMRERLTAAQELADEAVSLAERRGWASAPPLAAAYLARAWVQFHRNDVRAAATADRAASAAFGSGESAMGVAVALVRAQIAARDDGAAGAQRGLDLLHVTLADVSGWRMPALLESAIDAVEPRLLLAVGEERRALALLDRVEQTAETAVVRARYALANADAAGALELLERTLSASFSGRQLATRIELLGLDAVARQVRADHDGAAASMERALDLAERDGHLWMLIQIGPPLRELLSRQIRRGTAHRALVDTLLAQLDGRRDPEPVDQLLDPLSDRETEVLRYLPTLLTSAEIASELFVSVNTVKTHMKQIYRKLGTNRRQDTVTRARALRLL